MPQRRLEDVSDEFWASLVCNVIFRAIIPEQPYSEKEYALAVAPRSGRTTKALHEPERRENEQRSDDSGHNIS